MNFTDDNVTDIVNASNVIKDQSYVKDVIETAEKMHYISSGICAPIFMVIGIIGNMLSIIVWRKKPLRSSTGLYLITQAINDIGVLVFVFLSDSLVVLFPTLKSSYLFGVFHSYIGFPIFYFFVVNSIWTLVGVTVDRYIQVCWITQAKALCTDKAAKTGIFLITALCFIINTPHFNTYYPINTVDRKPGEPSYHYTDFGAGYGSQMYEFWVHCMFLVLAPWLTIFVLNMAILRRVTSLNKNMLQNRGEIAQMKAQRRENQLTKLLLTVTFTFLLLIALQCITQCFFMMKPEFSDTTVVSETYAVAKLGIVINSSINVFLYCVSGKRFRREMLLFLYSIMGCRFMVPVPDTSELYSVGQNKESPCSDARSQEKESRETQLRRMGTPQE